MRRAKTWPASVQATSALPSAATATSGSVAAARGVDVQRRRDGRPGRVAQLRGAHVAVLRPDRVGDAVDAHLDRQVRGAAARRERDRRSADERADDVAVLDPGGGQPRLARRDRRLGRVRAAQRGRGAPPPRAQPRQPRDAVLDVHDAAALLDAEIDDGPRARAVDGLGGEPARLGRRGGDEQEQYGEEDRQAGELRRRHPRRPPHRGTPPTRAARASIPSSAPARRRPRAGASPGAHRRAQR